MTRPSILERHITRLTSPAAEPRRPCPRCGNPRPMLGGARSGPFGTLPRYCCTDCNLRYSRLTGTPLARVHLERETFFRIVAHLGQPLAIRVAAAKIGVGEVTLARIVRELRAWLFEVSPNEQAKVRLGGLVLSPLDRAPRKQEAIDVVLTRTIDGAVHALRSRRDTPVPAQCPSCASAHVRLHQRANRHAPLPTFRCLDCGRNFTRLSGTPLARSRWPDKQRRFVRYLGIPLQLTEIAERLAVDYGTVRDWRERYSDLVGQIDPSGELAHRILMAPALTGQPCEHCGRVDALTWEETRRWHCAGCGRFLGKCPPARAAR